MELSNTNTTRDKYVAIERNCLKKIRDRFSKELAMFKHRISEWIVFSADAHCSFVDTSMLIERKEETANFPLRDFEEPEGARADIQIEWQNTNEKHVDQRAKAEQRRRRRRRRQQRKEMRLLIEMSNPQHCLRTVASKRFTCIKVPGRRILPA